MTILFIRLIAVLENNEAGITWRYMSVFLGIFYDIAVLRMLFHFGS